MRKLVREHTGWVWGTFGGVSIICSLLVAFVPHLPGFLKSLWYVAWICLPISVGLLIRLTQVNDKYADKITELEDSKRSSEASLKVEQARSVSLSTDHVELQGQLSDAQARILELETPAPTARDRELFDRLIKEWPWNGETLWWLEVVFNAKSWSSSLATQVVIYADVERETFFDDSTVDASYQEFKVACHKLSIWLTSESFSHPQNSDIQEIPDGSNRSGGWKEFDATRKKGRRLADAVINARRGLERTGRSQGL